MVLYYLSNDRHLPFSDIIDADERMQKRVFGTARLPEPCRAFEGMRFVIAKACAYDPEERYQSAAQLRQALEKVSKAPYGYCPECGKKLLKKMVPMAISLDAADSARISREPVIFTVVLTSF